MFDQSLRDKRVLVTQADVFMGPMLCEVLAGYGAKIIASTDTLMDPDAPASIVAAADPIDILIANLAIPAPTTMVTDVTEEEWHSTFAALVDPLPRLFKALLPAISAKKQSVLLGGAEAIFECLKVPSGMYRSQRPTRQWLVAAI